MLDLGALEFIILLVGLVAIAALYSSVGHGGATGYLAMMTLLGIAPVVARPGALWMNCVVASVAFVRFRGAGFFDGALFARLAVTSVPLAWWGSRVRLDGSLYAVVLAVVLAAAGLLLLRTPAGSAGERTRSAPLPVVAVTGAGLGFLAGLTGIGGGVFLTPLLILLGWARTKSAAGTTALFIVVNSAAGLIGLGAGAVPNDALLGWGPPLAAIGALVGTHYGVGRWPVATFRRALAVVLWIAAAKLLWFGS